MTAFLCVPAAHGAAVALMNAYAYLPYQVRYQDSRP